MGGLEKTSGKVPLEAQIIKDAGNKFEKAQQDIDGSRNLLEKPAEAAPIVNAKARPFSSRRLSTGSAAGKYKSSVRVFGERNAAEGGKISSLSTMGNRPEGEGRITFNFEDADLYEVIKTMAELLGINYIVDPGIKGKVTIHTAHKLRKSDLFPVFSQILEINGFAAMKDGGLYRIVPLKDAPRMPTDALFTMGQKDVPPKDRIIIQIIPLQYMSVQEMTKFLTPFLSSGGTIVASAPTNTLVVVDKGSNILKILELVETFDINMLARVYYRFYTLNYLDPKEVVKLIKEFTASYGKPPDGMVKFVALEHLNTFLAISTIPGIFDRIEEFVRQIDINVLDRVYYRFYPLEYLDAKEIAEIMKEFIPSYGKEASTTINFIALERLNTLLAISTMPDVFDKIEELVHQIDVVDESVAARIFIYFVKNGGADELATLLNNVLTGKKTEKQETKKAGGASEVPENPFSKAKMAEKKAEKTATKAGESTKKSAAGKKTSGKSGKGSSTLMGEVTITPDEIRNSLIIESTPSDYRIIQGILNKIDIMPRQVLIQATIAEITLDSSTEFGVEYALGQGAGALGAGFMATVGKSGLTYSIGVTNKWYAALTALATKDRLNVISSPHVLASDNQEAKIDVSREIPLASGQTSVSSGSTISETTIEYRDTGVILSVTPHINERGLVTMDISQEVSNLEGTMAVGRITSESANEYPVFSKRVVKTTLTVGHGQTIAIGGLIRDQEKVETRGLPCLIDMPVVKYLTGSWKKETEKIELIVLITPRVVDDMDDVEAMTNEFKQKVQSVMKQFYPQQ